MIKLTKEELKENFDTIVIYIEHGDEWREYCEKSRKGK